jgi:hypothetical protein
VFILGYRSRNSLVEGSLRDRSDIMEILVIYSEYLHDKYIGACRKVCRVVNYMIDAFGTIKRERGERV